MIRPESVLLDAQRGLEAAQLYVKHVEEGISNGLLDKSMQWALTGYVSQVDTTIKDYTRASIVSYMRHMGELTVPLWVFGVSKTANVYLRDLIKESQKQLEKERLKIRKADAADTRSETKSVGTESTGSTGSSEKKVSKKRKRSDSDKLASSTASTTQSLLAFSKTSLDPIIDMTDD